MLHAAKITAVTAVDLYTDPDHLHQIRQEFARKTGPNGYRCPIPDTMQPPRYEPEAE
jgi:aminobenzoyl-glutamate utilization protein B